VAEKQGIRYVFAGYCPAVFPSPHHAPPPLPPLPGQAEPAAPVGNRELWARDAARFTALFGGALNSRRSALGLAPVDDVRSHVFGEQPWLAADATLAPWPDPADRSVFQTGAWILADDRPLSPELTSFLDSGEPPVYFGFGSMRAPQELGRLMLDAARAVNRRAIVSRGWADLSLPDAEPGCFVIDEVNQQALFRRVAAVVHHGGAGTTTAAALAGAPQVIVPQLYDQHYWAARIQDLGIGTAHPPGVPTPASLTSALERTLQEGVAARAKSVARDVRRDGARVAAERLTQP
jgi:vancomycin aglycone glucosyltransferase